MRITKINPETEHKTKARMSKTGKIFVQKKTLAGRLAIMHLSSSKQSGKEIGVRERKAAQ